MQIRERNHQRTVCAIGVRPSPVFFEVGGSVAVGISFRIGSLRLQEVTALPCVGQSIAVRIRTLGPFDDRELHRVGTSTTEPAETESTSISDVAALSPRRSDDNDTLGSSSFSSAFAV